MIDLNHGSGCLYGAAGSNQIIDQNNFLSRFHRIFMHLYRCTSILKIIILGNRLTRQFSFFPYGYKRLM